MPAGFTVGSAHVQVLPSIRGLQRDLTRQLRGVKSGITSKVTPQLDRVAANKVEQDVRALGQRLARARDAEADAAGKVKVAEQRLNEMREAGKAKASQLTAAEEKLRIAHRDLASAQAATTRLTEQETQARQRLATATRDTERSNRGLLSSLRGISAGFRTVDDRPLRSTLSTLGKVGGASLVVAGGVAALGASVPGLISLAGALAAVASTAALIPAALGAGGLAVGTVLVGLVGLADRFKPVQARQATSAAASLAAARRAADRAAIAGAEQVRSAEQALARAQQTSRDAQVALTRARKDATEQLEDLRLALSGAGLDERAAELALRRARQRLAEAQAGGATGLDLEEAILGVDQANQSLAETRERYADLRAEATAAERAGVDGAENVVAAQRQVADATRGVQEAQRDLANTQRDAALAQQDAAIAMQQAQQRIVDTAPPELAPSALAFVAAVKELGPAWTALRLDVQERLFAGIAGHVRSLGGRYLPILREGLGGIAGVFNRGARGIADFFNTDAAAVDVSAALSNMRIGFEGANRAAVPLTRSWTDFLTVGSTFLPGLGGWLGDAATRWSEMVAQARDTGQLAGWIQGGLDRLRQLWDLAGNVGSVLGSVWSAARDAGADFLTTLRDVTGELAGALKTPAGAQGLRSFFAGLRGLVDGVKPGLRVIAGALGGLILALLPSLPKLGRAFSIAAEGARPLIDGLAWAATHVLPPLLDVLQFLAPALAPLAAMIGGIVLALKAWALIQAVLNAALWSNPIGLVVLALTGLVTGIILAYNHSERFRQIVQAAWTGIQITTEWAWRHVLKPAFDAFHWYLTRLLGPAVTWLWRDVVQPGFEAAGFVISGVWDNVVRPTFDALRNAVTTVADSFRAAVQLIDVQWSRLRSVAATPVNFVIDAVYNRGILAVWNAIAGVVGLSPLSPLPLIGAGPGISRAGGNQAFAAGGILPGYTPGRDVHTFVSPTAGVLQLSGGEPVLRPEAGRVLGAGWVDGINQAARAAGVGGVRRFLGGFARGGVLGRLEGIANTARGWTAGLFTDPLGTIRRMFGDPGATVRGAFGGSPFVDMLARMPARLVHAATDFLAGKANAMLGALTGGMFNGRGDWPRPVLGRLSANTAAAVEFVRQAFGIANIGTLGNRPNRSDHPLGKALDVMIAGWQSPAGIAKGNAIASWFVANPGRFGTKYVIWRDQINSGRGWAPYIHPLGPTNSPTLQHRDHVHVSLYDRGGLLPPGYSTVYNGTGRYEQVLDPRDSQEWRSGRGGTVEKHYHLTAQMALSVDPVAQFRRMEGMAGP